MKPESDTSPIIPMCKHNPHCECGICAFCNGLEDVWGKPLTKPSKCPFTPEEDEIMTLIVKAHNKFVGLERTHPSEIEEWVNAIHGLQNVLGMRILRRDYPETFPPKK